MKEWELEILEKEGFLLDVQEFKSSDKYEYLLTVVKRVMFMTNKQKIKDTLGDAIEKLENIKS